MDASLVALVERGLSPCAPPGELSQAQSALTQLKLAAISPTTQWASPQEKRAAQRRIGELAVGLALRLRDKQALASSLSFLAPHSPEVKFVALRLLFLLVESRLAEFFSALEAIPLSTRVAEPPVAFVARLERYLTEGSYEAVLNARSRVPESCADLFSWLLEDLEHTVRDEVAAGIEASYAPGALTVQKAGSLLNLTSEQATRAYVQQRESLGWSVQGDKVFFVSTRPPASKLTSASVPSDWSIRECLTITSELDRII